MDVDIYPESWELYRLAAKARYEIALIVVDRNKGSFVTIHSNLAELMKLRDMINDVEASYSKKETDNQP